MIRWILGILLVIVLILAIVFLFRRFTSGPDDINVDVPGEVANNGEAASQMPNVVGDSVATSAGQPVQGNVLDNDTDPQNEALTVTAEPVNGPTNGTLQLNVDGSFVYTPNAGYVGSDSFTYEVCDASGNCTTGTVQITVNSAVDAGSAEPGTSDGGEGAGADEPSGSDSSGDTTGTDSQPTDSGSGTSDAGTGSTDTSEPPSTGEGTQPTEDTSGSSAGTTDSGTADSSDSAANDAAGSGGAPSNVAGQPVTDPAKHAIKQGEWLIQIARCYGTSPETIVSQNNIPYPGWIMPDEELTISGVGLVSEPFFEPCIMFHTVVQGDTLYSLAQHYQVPLDMLIKANFGCYGYGYYYSPPVATPHDADGQGDETGWYAAPKSVVGPGFGAHSPYIYTGCYVPYYNPTIYIGQELVIPVNLDNADMRPAPTPTQ